jgi:hypothetical protein
MMTEMTAGTGIEPMITLPAWPDARVVPPGVPLSAVWTIAAILAAGGAVGHATLAGVRQRTFAAVAGGAVAAAIVAWLVAIPWSPEVVGLQVGALDLGGHPGTRIAIAAPEPPDHLVVWPMFPLGRVLQLAGLVALAAGLGAALLPQLSTDRGRLVLSLSTVALAIVAGARSATPGPDLLSFALAAPIVAIATITVLALAAVPIHLAALRARPPRG